MLGQEEDELRAVCWFVSRSFATTQLWLRWSAGPSSSSVAGTQRPRSGRVLREKCASAVDQPTNYSTPCLVRGMNYESSVNICILRFSFYFQTPRQTTPLCVTS